MKPRFSQHGSFTAELVVLVPVVVLFALLAVGLARFEVTKQAIVDAARSAAEAASVTASPSNAASTAGQAAFPGLQDLTHSCPNPIIATDTASFVPGGVVRVTVSCRVDLSGLLVPGLPGSLSVVVTQSAPIDPYRWVR